MAGPREEKEEHAERSSVFMDCEDSRATRDSACGSEGGSREVRKVATGQTTEGVHASRLMGSGLCLRASGSQWSSDCRSDNWGAVVRGAGWQESPGRAEKRLGRKMLLLGFQSSPGLPSHLGFMKERLISHDKF